ncbi:hypothetical protein A7Q09_05775 [Methylacidiphilum sp. Yel]|nr:hypothetical protein A7Q09_05775 [Methylacidiphilum sp. Yel]
MLLLEASRVDTFLFLDFKTDASSHLLLKKAFFFPLLSKNPFFLTKGIQIYQYLENKTHI